MTSPSIGLAMIVKDLNRKSIEALLDQVVPHVDQIVIVEANQDDKLGTVPKHMVGRVHNIEHFEWVDDFAAARNYSFSFLTTDYLLWLDDDDLVEGIENLREAAADAENNGFGAVHFEYQYRFDDKGRPTLTQSRERLLKRSLGWTWHDRVHEYCATESPHMVGMANNIVVVHQSKVVETERNLKLLLKMLDEDPDNARVWGALGQTYLGKRDFDKAVAYTEGFFHRVGNIDLKWHAATDMAKIHLEQKNWAEAVQWCHAAMDIHPDYALSYLLLARVAWFGYQDAERCLFHIGQAEGLQEAPLHVERQPDDYTLNRWDVEHRALYELDRYVEAMEIVRLGLSLATDRRKWNYFEWYYHERINSEKSVRAAADLVNHLFCRGDTLAALPILANLPVSIREDPRIQALIIEVNKATEHVFDEDKYRAFYENLHSHVSDDPNNTMNAIDVETYRLDPLIKRLKARGAKRILDVGCGAGEPAIYLAKAGFTVVGIDVNGHAINEAKKRGKKAFGTLKRNGVKALSVEFRQGTYDTLGPEDIGRFDAVVMMEIIEHIHPSKVPFYLASAEDFLNPDGAVFLTTPGMHVGDIPGIGQNFPRDHVKEFTREDLENLLVNYPGKRLKKPISLFRLYNEEVPVPGFATWFMEYEARDEKLFERDWTPEWEQPVVIYVGPGLENWTPDSPEETGIGGSETWAVKTARELRAKGHPVIVYAMCDGVWEGVVYRNYRKYNPKQETWLTIISRYVEMLDERPNAQTVLFIAHDTDYGDALNETRLANMDRYCVMSEWQRHHTIDVTNLAQHDEGELYRKLHVISNGIEPSYFEGTDEVEKVPHSFVWSSSPDRGLDVLLSWWAAIRAEWPDATLNIAYGFENIDALSRERPHLVSFKSRVQSLAKQPGVTWKGRMGQRDLAKLMQETQFWLYPAVDAFGQPWHETFCITALEAQMAGCVPIFPAVGALPERFYLGSMAEDAVMSESWAIDMLQMWDEDKYKRSHIKQWLDIRDVIAADYSWTRATERLLEAVKEPVAV